MPKNIPRSKYDFLKDHPPFNLLDKSDLLALSEKITAKNEDQGGFLFRQDEAIHPYVYIVRTGAVLLFRKDQEEEYLVDFCDEGDIFGLRSLSSDTTYRLSALCKESSLIYILPVEDFRTILERNPEAKWYFVKGFDSGIHSSGGENTHRKTTFQEREKLTQLFDDSLLEIQGVSPKQAPVTCTPETTIQEASIKMQRDGVGSIIVVNAKKQPLGIVTHKDLGVKVATGVYSIDRPVGSIMSSPVHTIPDGLSIAEVQIEMLNKKIRHLVVTTDGTLTAPVVGVISQHDIFVVEGNNPATLMREIKYSASVTLLQRIRGKIELMLKRYLAQEVAISYISNVTTRLNDALVQRVIELSIAEMEQEGCDPPETSFCFLALGSAGREEQLLRTDQDNAIVFEDPPQAVYSSTKQYFLQLGAKINAGLYECGFEYCPGEMMARNPNWCKSLAEWKKQLTGWLHQPTNQHLMLGTIFFDYRAVFGDRNLVRDLTQHIYQLIDKESLFLSYLANDALKNPPPLSFFRNFVVERDGEHKNEFDIKGRALMPLADAARVLALKSHLLDTSNTVKRFEKLAETDPPNRELYHQAIEAYQNLIRYRTVQGLKNEDDGRYFNPADLSKLERLTLKNSFRPARELQELLMMRFQLGYLR